MLNSLVEFKNSIVHKFGPVLGYVILAICAIAALSVIAFLIKTAVTLAIILAVASAVFFGAYKISELVKAKKANQ
ncbi:MAG: hypothetical protein N2376_00965 [Clostridia bacterium]|nr:hypothetical protein [Clostridia bacterium]